MAAVITKADKADSKYIGGWDGVRTVKAYSLTVNVLSMMNTDIDVEVYGISAWGNTTS